MTTKYYAKIENIIEDTDSDGITYSGCIVTYTDDPDKPRKFIRRFQNTTQAAAFARSLKAFIIHANGNTENLQEN